MPQRIKCSDPDQFCFIARLCDAKGACALKAFIKYAMRAEGKTEKEAASDA